MSAVKTESKKACSDCNIVYQQTKKLRELQLKFWSTNWSKLQSATAKKHSQKQVWETSISYWFQLFSILNSVIWNWETYYQFIQIKIQPRLYIRKVQKYSVILFFFLNKG